MGGDEFLRGNRTGGLPLRLKSNVLQTPQQLPLMKGGSRQDTFQMGRIPSERRPILFFVDKHRRISAKYAEIIPQNLRTQNTLIPVFGFSRVEL